MNYIIANDQGTLTSLGAADQTVMFPSNMILGMDVAEDTGINLFVVSPLDTDDGDALLLKHADTNTAKLDHRKLIDECVSLINGDYNGAAVLFDAANDVKLPTQVLAGSTVTQDD